MNNNIINHQDIGTWTNKNNDVQLTFIRFYSYKYREAFESRPNNTAFALHTQSNGIVLRIEHPYENEKKIYQG